MSIKCQKYISQISSHENSFWASYNCELESEILLNLYIIEFLILFSFKTDINGVKRPSKLIDSIDRLLGIN